MKHKQISSQFRPIQFILNPATTPFQTAVRFVTTLLRHPSSPDSERCKQAELLIQKMRPMQGGWALYGRIEGTQFIPIERPEMGERLHRFEFPEDGNLVHTVARWLENTGTKQRAEGYFLPTVTMDSFKAASTQGGGPEVVSMLYREGLPSRGWGSHSVVFCDGFDIPTDQLVLPPQHIFLSGQKLDSSSLDQILPFLEDTPDGKALYLTETAPGHFEIVTPTQGQQVSRVVFRTPYVNYPGEDPAEDEISAVRLNTKIKRWIDQPEIKAFQEGYYLPLTENPFESASSSSLILHLLISQGLPEEAMHQAQEQTLFCGEFDLVIDKSGAPIDREAHSRATHRRKVTLFCSALQFSEIAIRFSEESLPDKLPPSRRKAPPPVKPPVWDVVFTSAAGALVGLVNGRSPVVTGLIAGAMHAITPGGVSATPQPDQSCTGPELDEKKSTPKPTKPQIVTLDLKATPPHLRSGVLVKDLNWKKEKSIGHIRQHNDDCWMVSTLHSAGESKTLTLKGLIHRQKGGVEVGPILDQEGIPRIVKIPADSPIFTINPDRERSPALSVIELAVFTLNPYLFNSPEPFQGYPPTGQALFAPQLIPQGGVIIRSEIEYLDDAALLRILKGGVAVTLSRPSIDHHYSFLAYNEKTKLITVTEPNDPENVERITLSDLRRNFDSIDYAEDFSKSTRNKDGSISYPGGIRYLGAVDEAGLPHGNGEMIYPDGTTTSGGYDHGKSIGKLSIINTKSGETYAGESLLGLRHGQGLYKTPKYTYTGDFRYGLMSGPGKIEDEHSFKEGEFFGPNLHGKGTLTLKHPQKGSNAIVSYSGLFAHDVPQGIFEITRGDGRKVAGKHVNGIISAL